MKRGNRIANKASQRRALRALDGLSGASRLQVRRCWRRYVSAFHYGAFIKKII